jgi:hypothetical protein
MQISKVTENLYEISDGEEKISFSREKFEDLYYAVPVNTTAFLRLLQDNICANVQERHTLNRMLDKKEERVASLEDLQKQIQRMTL